jgi:hypothetical protein
MLGPMQPRMPLLKHSLWIKHHWGIIVCISLTFPLHLAPDPTDLWTLYIVSLNVLATRAIYTAIQNGTAAQATVQKFILVQQ